MNRYRSLDRLSLKSNNEEEENQQHNYVISVPNKNQHDQHLNKNHQQNDLRYRLYDKGLSVRTMPSVKRPETSNTQNRPLSAKLYVKNKLTPLMSQVQPSNMSPSQAAQAFTGKDGNRSNLNSQRQLEPLNYQPKMGQTSSNFGNFQAFEPNKTGKSNFFTPKSPLPDEDDQLQILDQRLFNDHIPQQQQIQHVRSLSKQSLYRPTTSNNLNTLNPMNRLISTSPVGSLLPVPHRPESTNQLLRVNFASIGSSIKSQTPTGFYTNNVL